MTLFYENAKVMFAAVIVAVAEGSPSKNNQPRLADGDGLMNMISVIRTS
jgi:hypothetical protein